MSEQSPSEVSNCPRCGAPLPPGEICLRCAGRIAFGAELAVPPGLETIARKCLAKEPEARYASAAELVEDLEGLLYQSPSSAPPSSWALRTWRWARRNPRVAALAATAVMLLAAVAVGSTIAAVRLSRASPLEIALHQEAETRLGQGEKLIGFMLSDLADRLEPEGRLAVLERSIVEVDKFYAAVPAEKATSEDIRIRAKAAGLLGQIRFAQGRFAEAGASYERASVAYRQLAARDSGNVEWQLGLDGVLDALVATYGLQREFAKCIPILTENLGIHQALVRKEPQNVAWLARLGCLAQRLALATTDRGDLVRTGELLRIAEDAGRRAVALEPSVLKHQEALALTLGTLGDYLKKVAKIDDALEAYEEKLRILRELAAQEPKNQEFRFALVLGLSQPALIDLERGHYHEARQALLHAAEMLDPMIAADPANRDWQILRIHLLTSLGLACQGEGDAGAALVNFQRVWDLSHEHPEMLTAYPRWAADCHLAADRAGALLRELAEQDRQAGRAEEAVTAEAAAAEWRARAGTLPAP